MPLGVLADAQLGMRYLLLLIALTPLFFSGTAHAAAFAGVDDFDGYTVGDLSGKNGGSGFSGAWSGHANFDVQSTTFVSSPNGISVTGAANNNIVRALSSSVDSGNAYIAMRASGVTTAGAYANFDVLDSTNQRALGIQITPLGGSSNLTANGTASETLISSIAANTWYIIHIEFLSSTTFRARAKISGGSYGSFTSTLTFQNSISSPTRVAFQQNGVPTFYFDSLQPTDPEAPPAADVSVGTFYWGDS